MTQPSERTYEILGYSRDSRGWNSMLQEVLHPAVSAKAAKGRHQRGDGYGAVVVDQDDVLHTVHLRREGGVAGVARYDQTRQQPYLTVDYRELDGRLWLVQYGRRNGGTRTVADQQLVYETFFWAEPGATGVWSRFDHDHRAGRHLGEQHDYDHEPHWRDWPDHASYDHLLAPLDHLDALWPGAPPLPFLGP